MTDIVDWNAGSWLNRPAHAVVEAGRLTLATDRATDFWRETHYDFVRDNGHFLGFPAAAEFTAQLRVRGRYEQLYDQAGLMLRASPQHWIKAGVEFSDGLARLSTVVTAGRSDWSLSRIDGDASNLWLRLTLAQGAARIQASVDGRSWTLLRLAPFAAAGPVLVGPMACTPEREGLRVEFSDLAIGPPLGTDLHDQT